MFSLIYRKGLCQQPSTDIPVESVQSAWLMYCLTVTLISYVIIGSPHYKDNNTAADINTVISNY